MVSIAEFSKDPQYTIKVLSERTGVQAVTLRAWERRYRLIIPERMDNNYRLYSEQDIQVVRWITHRMDDGLAISKAAKEYHALRENGIWPEALPTVLIPEPAVKPRHQPKVYARKLFDALTSHNEVMAKKIIDDIQSMFDLKVIFLDIFSPCLYQIGDAWYRGKIRIATEHFASAFIRGILMKLLTAFPIYSQAPKLLIGCPQEEFHELASLMLAVLLRREGYLVEYLGADLPIDDLVFYAEDSAPGMVIMSASFEHSARPLYQLQEKLDLLPSKPKLGFGGRYFNENPQVVNEIGGIFLGVSLDAAINHVHDLLD